MLHIEVDIGNSPAEEEKVIKTIKKVLTDKGRADVSVNVSVVGKEEMTKLAMEYFGEDEKLASEHPVLSFVEEEALPGFSEVRENYLGEIVVVWNGEKTYDWIEHGTLHLLGIHHD